MSAQAREFDSNHCLSVVSERGLGGERVINVRSSSDDMPQE